jgi:hemin uptake protein HemP
MRTHEDRRPTLPPPIGEGQDVVGGGDASSSIVPCPQIDSEQILGGASEVRINHHGAIYRLKLTSLGKLILTK